MSSFHFPIIALKKFTLWIFTIYITILTSFQENDTYAVPVIEVYVTVIHFEGLDKDDLSCNIFNLNWSIEHLLFTHSNPKQPLTQTPTHWPNTTECTHARTHTRTHTHTCMHARSHPPTHTNTHKIICWLQICFCWCCKCDVGRLRSLTNVWIAQQHLHCWVSWHRTEVFTHNSTLLCVTTVVGHSAQSTPSPSMCANTQVCFSCSLHLY